MHKVRFLNWCTKYSSALKVMHNDFKIDTGDNETSLIEFCEYIYKNDKNIVLSYFN